MRLIFVLIVISLTSNLFAQDLLGERIRRLTSRKKSIFLDKGVFHNGAVKSSSELKAIRHSYSKNTGYERIVFDFSTKKLPRIYGHISQKHRKIYIDLFNTTLSKSIGSFGSSRFVESVNFYPLSKNSVSIELTFKSDISADIFYLESPGRLVADMK